MEISALLWTAGKAFLIAFVLCPIFRDVFRSYNIVDRPGLRKVHAYPIPRIGGIPLAIAYGVTLLGFSASVPSYVSPAWMFLPGMAMIFLTGLLDDFFNLKPAYKLLGEIAAAAIAFYSGLRIEIIGDIAVPAWIGLPATIFWLLLATNAFNLIDGLDGLCAGVGFIATLTFFAVALVQGNTALEYATLPLAGALLGFLCHNFHPATMFLGDSGALLIGFVLGCYGVMSLQNTPALPGLAVPLLALSIPLTDVSLAIARRLLKNRPIFGADREHMHHRLLDRGLSPKRAVFALYLFATIGAAFAMLLSAPSLGRFQVFIVLGIGLTAWVGIRHLRYAEFDVTGKLLFRGEFQRAVEQRVGLAHLASALRRCKTEDECWTVLVNAAREVGWARIKWTGQHATREQVLHHQPPVWSFSITLGDKECVQFDGAFQASRTSVDILGLAEIIRSSFADKRREWEEPALS